MGGGLKIHVFSLGGKKADSNAQKMIIYAKKKDKVQEAENKAKIAQAKLEEKKAKNSGSGKIWVA